MVLVTCSSIGCKKKDTKNSETIDFIIENIQDIDIKAGHSSDLQLDIKGIASLQEIVSLETIGLPDNVAATYSASKGFPSYSSIVTFRAGINAVVGDYPIKIRGASPSTGPKEYELTLHLHDGDFFYLGRAGFNVRSVFSNSPDDTYDTYVNSSSVMGFRTSFLGSAPPPVGKYKIVPHPYSSM